METSSSSTSKKKGGGKVVGVLVVIALLALVVIMDMRRRDAEKRLTELSMQVQQPGGNQAQNQEAAKEIIAKVRKLYAIPEGIDPTVATIVDVNQLRARNAFYNKAKNGDHLIVTNDRAILYDPVADRIVDVVPVQIQPTSSAPGGTAPPKVAPTPPPAAASSASAAMAPASSAASSK